MVSTDLQTHMVSLSEIVPYAGNAKEHPEWQVDQLVSSIEKFGNCDPIAAWHNQRGQLEIVEGHGRLMALEKLGYEEAPVIFLDHLTDEQRRAYALVHNQLTMNTGFDMEILSVELDAIVDIDMEQFGFDAGISIDGFGEDFELPDGEAPEFKTVSLHMTAEQYELFEEMQEQVEASGEEGNMAARQVCEVIRQWQAQRM